MGLPIGTEGQLGQETKNRQWHSSTRLIISCKSHSLVWVQKRKRQMVWLILRQGADRQVRLKDNLARELRMPVGISEEAISQYDRHR